MADQCRLEVQFLTQYLRDHPGNDGLPGGPEYTGENGGNGGKMVVELTGSENVSNAISFEASGGNGSEGKRQKTDSDIGYGGNGGNGGDAVLNLKISGEAVEHQAVELAATGGNGAAAGDGAYDHKVTLTANDVLGNGGAGGRAEVGITVAAASYQAGDITLSAAGGNGADGKTTHSIDHPADKTGERVGGGGRGGSASAAGFILTADSSSVKSVTAADVKITATGGTGGKAPASNSSYFSGALGGIGGAAEAYGIKVAALLPQEVSFNVKSIEITAAGGDGGATETIKLDNALNEPNAGGNANAYGIFNNRGSLTASVTDDIVATATGGNGGSAGFSISGTERTGATGGIAVAAGLYNEAGKSSVEAPKITVKAEGGNGGRSGRGVDGGPGGGGGTGGDGGDGGSAYAYGVLGKGSGSHTVIAVDQIIAEAKAGAGGTASAGQNGQNGEMAEAYGVYAEEGAVIILSATPDNTDNGTIKIGAKASDAEGTGSKAYAVYADNATVLFNDTATLNTSDGTTANPDIITYLNNATLGFGTPGEGQNVGRTITGSTLQLEGSNTFRVATDLANNKADSFKFESLAGSSTATQYITVGYDKSFDGSKLDSFSGDVTVLTVEDLKGQSLNFVGKESEMDDPLTRFLATPTVEVDGKNVKITQIDFKEDGASETVLTVADAQMSIGNLWRVEGNNLMKRMGELRSDPEAADDGVWARYYRGEMSADSAYDRSFDQDYTAFQGGIDKMQDYKGGKLYTGIAVNRIDSNANYLAGSGDLSSTGVGVYASWLGSKGHYLDVIARGSKLANDFKLVDKNGREANADYDTWAYGISAEYGYRQNLQGGWFVEPQAELSLGRIGSADYTTSNGVSIKQDAVNSAVTRLGVLSGKEFTMNGRQGNVYLKASLLHDFGGNGGGAAYYNDRSTVVESADMSGTWWEIGLGANLGIAKNSNLYFDALKTFGGDLRTDWQFNAGLRFTF
ncbi:autotransporter outer membrane beta-barrel domain-containing protein [Phascolarctobacterium sp.]